MGDTDCFTSSVLLFRHRLRGLRFRITRLVYAQQRYTPLHWAMRESRVEVVKMLLENGADMELKQKACADS